MNMRHNSHTKENAVQTKLMNIYIYIYRERERERDVMSTTFSQQILSGRLVVIVRTKK